MELTEHITLAGVPYTRVRSRRNGSGVYVSEDGASFARYGEQAAIEAEYRIHAHLEQLGFPVPKVLDHHLEVTPAYFIERSLGSTHLGTQFEIECRDAGTISQRTFEEYRTVVEQFAKAQAGTSRTDSTDWEACATGVHVQAVLTENPQSAQRYQEAFTAAQQVLADLGWVVTHGDFNPHNIFPGGVIDFEDQFLAPAGYDLITTAVHIAWFPETAIAEYQGKYALTSGQRRELIDRLSAFAPIHRPEVFGAYAFMRGCWSAAHLDEWPKLQKWRFALLDKVAARVIAGEDQLANWIETGRL